MEHWQLVIIVLFFDRFTDVNGFFFIKPPKSDSYDPFFFHKKLTDQYGEYTYGDGRTKTYNYCFDVRHSVKNQCRPTSSWFHDNPNDIEDNPWYWSNYGSSKYPYYPNYYNHHHHHYYPSAIDDDETHYYNQFDGRNNVLVGSGRAYYRRSDQTMEIECRFPSSDRLISSIVWYRKTRSGIRNANTSNRFKIKSLGRNGSVLTIRDYRSYVDDGVYRCFATRRSERGSYSYRSSREAVYVETAVSTSSAQTSGSGSSSNYYPCPYFCSGR